METTNSFGYWIRRQRKAHDLTQQVLADRVGCSLAAIKKIESDERKPSRQIAERLADVLGVPADQREIFLEVARGKRPADQLYLARESTNPSHPSGTVTFLYTDIEGSTKLAQQYGEVWEALRKRHHAILRAAIETYHGYIFQTIGDAICAAFHTAQDALRAAIKSQIDLHNEKGEDEPIKVRMGIHTGKAEIQDDGQYHGYISLSHVQRLMSAGHGGQVLTSFTTQQLVQDELSEGVELRDLGEHRLKDFDRAEHIFQVVAPDLPANFPPLMALATIRNNLPAQLTSFVGREREMAEVKQLLSNTRLLTLTGPGGTGKTRLALQLALEVLEAFTDGVWLVELAPLSDPTLVTQTVASTLSVWEQPQHSILDALTDYVRAKNMLLILDNCEHLITACAQLADTLLHAAPHLKILTSSREALGIAGEASYRLPSLALPDPHQLCNLEVLAQNECVRLFVDRALAVYPSFHLKEKNAPAIVDICRRLDGIPLAIELAAARTKVFTPGEIASRLDDRFKLLISGSRTALERHQTLFALIDWSYDLLSDEERRLFRQLSVFAGSWTFEATETVCSELDVLNLLTQLVNKSLVFVEEYAEGTRYRILETIRQYASDKLLESGEAEKVRNRHLAFFIRFAETAEPKLRGAEQLQWLERVETEHDNLRTALAWSLESGKSDAALRLVGTLFWFWHIRGYWSEGQRWLNEVLSLDEYEQIKLAASVEKHTPTPTETARRAMALYGAAILQFSASGLSEAARSNIEESLQLWRMLDDKWWTALALKDLGQVNYTAGDISTARAQCEESVEIARHMKDRWVLAAALSRLGRVLHDIDVRAAQPITEEAVAIAREVGDKSTLSYALVNLVVIYFFQGNYRAITPVAEEAWMAARAIGNKINMVYSLAAMGLAAIVQGNLVEATDNLVQLLVFAREMGSSMAMAYPLLGFGAVAVVSGQPQRAVHLLGAVESLLLSFGIEVNTWSGGTGALYRKFLQLARAQLDETTFNAAMAEGRALTMEQAIAFAQENEDSPLPKDGLESSSDA